MPGMTPLSAGENQMAGDAFVHWASLQDGAPRDVRSLLEHVAVTHDYIGLIETDLRGQRVVWKSVPAAGRARITLPPPIVAEEVDAWVADAPSLRKQSDHVALCDPCAGAGKTRCAACDGSGKRTCGACGGERKAYGYTANGAWRLLNCTACRGKGAVDCAECRRGVAVCAICAGEGRVQRWLELEWWRRSIPTVHPQQLASRFGWMENPVNEIIERDAHVIADLERPHVLAASDLGDIPLQWLEVLEPVLMSGERVQRQRLRIARVPTHTVHYRVGAAKDSVAFAGRRLSAPREAAAALFVIRAANLRALLLVLVAIYGVIVLVSLARGPFFWSMATLASLVAFGAALASIYRASADWTASRLETRKWFIAITVTLIVAIAFAFAALPRVGRADGLIAAGKLDDAESELQSLGGSAGRRSWADLRLARIRQATELEAARTALAQIPRELPQYGEATDAIDQLILTKAREAASAQRWTDGSDALRLLSARARGKPESAAVSAAVHIPLARQKLARKHWSEAADSVIAAQSLGVSSSEWQTVTDAIHAAGLSAAASARRERDLRSRFRSELTAEEILVSWERTAEVWGTPPLIALRVAMARDVAAIERSERRRAQ